MIKLQYFVDKLNYRISKYNYCNVVYYNILKMLIIFSYFEEFIISFYIGQLTFRRIDMSLRMMLKLA